MAITFLNHCNTITKPPSDFVDTHAASHEVAGKTPSHVMNGTLYPTTFEVAVDGTLKVVPVVTLPGDLVWPKNVRVTVPLTQEMREKLLELISQWDDAVLSVLENES